jgi:hypothetical protein
MRTSIAIALAFVGLVRLIERRRQAQRTPHFAAQCVHFHEEPLGEFAQIADKSGAGLLIRRSRNLFLTQREPLPRPPSIVQRQRLARLNVARSSGR